MSSAPAYDIEFPPVINSAIWLFEGGAHLAETSEDLDVTAFDWTFEILDPVSRLPRLTASNKNGQFRSEEPGKFEFYFSREEMETLDPQTYPTRLVMADGEDTAELSVSPLQVAGK